MSTEPTVEAFHCSFCGKPRSQVEKLVSGPRVFICDECVNLCVGIIDQEPDPEKAAKQREKVIASQEVQSAFAERDRVQRLLGMWVRTDPPDAGARRRIESAFRDDPELPASAASILEAARTTSDSGEAESRAIFALNVATTTAVCEDLDAAVSYFEARGHRALERWDDDDGDHVMLRRPDKGFLILVEDLDDE